MNTSKKTQLALVYIRYSSHAQDNGNSPAAQMTCAENYTEAHQMTIEQIYHDYAKTGRNTNREGYQQMKNDILSGKVQAKIVVVRALDRLHRNTGNQIEDLKWMESHGIRLIAVNDSIDTASEDYSKFATIVKAAAAEETSDNISKNTRAALLESARQCRHLGGVPPIGYTVNEAGLYEIDPLTAPIVRDLYTLYSSGMGYSYIKKHLRKGIQDHRRQRLFRHRHPHHPDEPEIQGYLHLRPHSCQGQRRTPKLPQDQAGSHRDPGRDAGDHRAGTLRQSPGEAGTEPPADSQQNRQELLRPQRLHTLSEVRQAVLRQRQPQQRAQVPAVPKKL